MDGVSKQMVRVLANATVNPAVTPVIANVTAEYEHDADDIRKNLASQVSSPVRWEETLQKFLGDGFDTFVEVGHGTVLGGIIRRVSKDSAVYETNTVEAVEQTIRVLKGGD
jgi:[acyl-carrier-protein] S-malonyltransferase